MHREQADGNHSYSRSWCLPDRAFRDGAPRGMAFLGAASPDVVDAWDTHRHPDNCPHIHRSVHRNQVPLWLSHIH